MSLRIVNLVGRRFTTMLKDGQKTTVKACVPTTSLDIAIAQSTTCMPADSRLTVLSTGDNGEMVYHRRYSSPWQGLIQ